MPGANIWRGPGRSAGCCANWGCSPGRRPKKNRHPWPKFWPSRTTGRPYRALQTPRTAAETAPTQRPSWRNVVTLNPARIVASFDNPQLFGAHFKADPAWPRFSRTLFSIS
jgi:hypothetical protein